MPSFRLRRNRRVLRHARAGRSCTGRGPTPRWMSWNVRSRSEASARVTHAADSLDSLVAFRSSPPYSSRSCGVCARWPFPRSCMASSLGDSSRSSFVPAFFCRAGDFRCIWHSRVTRPATPPMPTCIGTSTVAGTIIIIMREGPGLAPRGMATIRKACASLDRLTPSRTIPTTSPSASHRLHARSR